ncbi:MAG TPA: PIG-L family deacetylase [Bdellovibrionota bacterium]|jgi:LmbE family N-acetylglucosaminyl deacetylase
MKSKAYRLLVVAHPDDETIFFSGVLLGKRDLPWRVVCLTDGNADGRGAERQAEFRAATKLLGAKASEQWDYKDIFEQRLPVDEIAARLRALPAPKEVYSHGPLGEYGHPHHQDCSLAVHRAFPKLKIFSPAWNCNADFVMKLSPAQFKKKSYAFAEIYGKETARFVTIVPNMPVEGFRRFHSNEVEALVGFFRREHALDSRALKDTSWAGKMLPQLRDKLETRLF